MSLSCNSVPPRAVKMFSQKSKPTWKQERLKFQPKLKVSKDSNSIGRHKFALVMYFACCTGQRSRTNPARAQVWLCTLGENTCWQNPGVSLVFLSCILDKVLAAWQTGCIVSSPSPTVQFFSFDSVCFLHPGSFMNFLCKRADLSPQRRGPFPHGSDVLSNKGRIGQR